jgi:hypothetical protein
MGGHAFFLPKHNLPAVGVVGQQSLSDDARLNFGLFQPLQSPQTEIDHGLKVREYQNVLGVKDAPLGLGVLTTVY